MRNIKIAPGEHYHIFNRGSNKQIIFLDDTDRTRFLFLILYFQSPTILQNIGRSVRHFVKHSVFNINKDVEREIVDERFVEVLGFCLMPNHFHLIVKEAKEGGISRYMQRLLNAYTKYFNTKYKKSGHLFQGPYRAVHVRDDRQLIHLSAYIHRNPRELKGWTGKEEKYRWSSYQDFISENRWGGLLMPELISEQFKSKDEYKKFVKTSLAKIFKEELEELSLVYKDL
jgi:putative transposase